MVERYAPGDLLDPRGELHRREVALAPGVSIEDLRRGPVLFYNNTKLEAGEYVHVFPRIKEHFARRGIENLIDFRETPRGKGAEGLRAYAEKLAAKKPVAAILGLADIGVTPATTIVAIALEQIDVPTVLLTAGPGVKLSQVVASYRAGRLRRCALDLYQGSTKEEVIDQVDRVIDRILLYLTGAPEQVASESQLEITLDSAPTVFSGDLQELMDRYDSAHIGDGLPVIPPTAARLERMLSYCPLDPAHALASEIGPSGKDITVRDIAVAAVMAGCKPEYMPVLLTAFKALADPRYNLLQAVTTSHPGGDLILVSGPLAKQIGLHGGQGCLGPGFRANATIGRAVNLVAVNCCRSVPDVADLGCLASPAEYSYCFAEDADLTPWTTINEERFDRDTTAVMVLKAEPPHDIIDFLSQTGGDLLDTIADSCTTLGSNNSYMPGNLLLVLTPDHSRLLARDGYTKEMIREHIHRNVHHPAPMVRNRGLTPVRPAGWENRHPMPALHSEAVIEPVLLQDGSPAQSIEQFRGR